MSSRAARRPCSAWRRLAPFEAQAAGDLVALVHTQAAGDNGPVDSMIAKLQQLSKDKGFATRIVYASDPATYETIFRTLGDAGASVVVSTFNEVAEPIKALAPTYPKTKWIQLFADPIKPPLPNVATVSYDYYLGCYLSGLFGALDLEDRQARLYRRHFAAAAQRGRQRDQGRRDFGQRCGDAERRLRRLLPGPCERPGNRHPDVSGRRRLYPDGLGRDRRGHHRRGERRRGPPGERHFSGAIQARAQDRRHARGARLRPVAL